MFVIIVGFLALDIQHILFSIILLSATKEIMDTLYLLES